MPFNVNVPKHGCCKDLSQALAAECCLRSDETLLLAEVYQHKIYRYLEDPSELLYKIKDEEHIVAYRFSRTQAELIRLEICHRYQGKYVSDNLNASEKKPFLTPLVTYLEDPHTGADIELGVKKVLSTLKRHAYSTSAKESNHMENGSASEAIEESTSSCSTEYGPMDTDNSKLEESSSGKRSFQLCITDDRGINCRPISKYSPIKPGQLVRVILDWTEKENGLYDANYLKDLPEVHKTGLTSKKTRQDAISLFSCLDAFLKEEPLGPDDMWYCPSCKEHRQASKKLDLWRLPEILVCHLKRFSYSRYLKNKLDFFVNFPIHNLDLSKYLKSKGASTRSHVYELYAISNHYGGLGGGHYTAYAKLIDENKWYHFDDANVSPVSEADIKTSAAYVLFYKRVPVEPNEDVAESSRGYVTP